MRGKATFLFFLGMIVVGLSCAPVEDRKKAPSVALKDEGKEDPVPEEPVIIPAELKPRLQAALQHIHARELDTTFNFWTIFHGILGMGLDTPLVERETGKRHNAVEYICQGGKLNGLEFIIHPEGIGVRIGPVPDGQGHQDQFAAEMGQWGMKADRKFIIQGKEFTFLDFVRYSKAFASPHQLELTSYGKVKGAREKGQELSWAIVLIPQYFGIDVPPWINKFGEKVSLESLIRAELKIDMPNAACGGTHSLFGLTWAYHLHLQKGGKTEGVWADVAAHLEKYKGMARKYQNPDGSFAESYVNGPGEPPDATRRINTTGHTLEWLALYLPEDELRAPWVQDAVMVLCKTILDRPHTGIDGGGLYHATHGLHLYHHRLFGPFNPANPPLMPPVPKRKP